MSSEVIVHNRIAAIAKDDWDRCFAAEPESWAYYRAVEEAGIPGFEWRYFAVLDDGRLSAVVPAFVTTYRLDTTVRGPMKRFTERLARWAPGLLSIRLASFGSPIAEACHLGFAPEIGEERKPALLHLLIAGLRRFARENGIGLIAVKDVPGDATRFWEACLGDFQRTPGLPTAILSLPFRTFEDYLKSLSRTTRKDMRRKLRAQNAIRIEYRTTIDDVMPQIEALYAATVARSDLRFERLPGAYFERVLAALPGEAHCVLYWKGPELLAFNLVLRSQRALIDKFIGMREDARDHNLYFLSWMENVRRCIAMGLPAYQSGQAGYAVKVRLGSTLTLNWMYFRHLDPLINFALRIVAQIVRLDRFDREIRMAVGALK